MDEDELIEKVVHLLNMHNKAEHGEQIQDSIKVVETGTADTDVILLLIHRLQFNHGLIFQ